MSIRGHSTSTSGLGRCRRAPNGCYTNTPADEQCNVDSQRENAQVLRSDVNFPSGTG